jgi:hypothetical protein
MIHLSRRVLQCLAKELAHEGFKPQRVEDDDCFARCANKLFAAKRSQHTRERLAGDIQLGRHNTFGVFKLDLEWDVFMGNRALSQQPVNAARFRILESEIIEKRDDAAQMLAHRRKHSQCKLRPFAQ